DAGTRTARRSSAEPAVRAAIVEGRAGRARTVAELQRAAAFADAAGSQRTAHRARRQGRAGVVPVVAAAATAEHLGQPLRQVAGLDVLQFVRKQPRGVA